MPAHAGSLHPDSVVRILSTQAVLLAEPAEGDPTFTSLSPAHASCTGLCAAPSLIPAPGFLVGLQTLHLSYTLILWLGKGPQGTGEASLHQPRLVNTGLATYFRTICCQGLCAPPPAWVLKLGTRDVVKPWPILY